MNGFSSAISAVGGAVGRYFSVVSFIPSLFLAWSVIQNPIIRGNYVCIGTSE